MTPFTMCVIVLVLLAVLGLPIGLSMLAASVFYLLLAGLDPGYAAAITASAAIIGPIIPPSIPMVIYALVSDASIGYLFLGGVVPGLMLGVAFMIMNTMIARRRDYPVEASVPLREIPKVTIAAF